MSWARMIEWKKLMFVDSDGIHVHKTQVRSQCWKMPLGSRGNSTKTEKEMALSRHMIIMQ